jgi:hypothetical protein
MFGHAWPASTHWPSQQRNWVGEGQICPASGGGTHIAPGGMQPQGEMTSGGGQTLPPSTLQMGPMLLPAAGGRHWQGTVLAWVGSQSQVAPGGKQPQGVGTVLGGSQTGQATGQALSSGMQMPSPPQPQRYVWGGQQTAAGAAPVADGFCAGQASGHALPNGMH